MMGAGQHVPNLTGHDRTWKLPNETLAGFSGHNEPQTDQTKRPVTRGAEGRDSLVTAPESLVTRISQQIG